MPALQNEITLQSRQNDSGVLPWETIGSLDMDNSRFRFRAWDKELKFMVDPARYFVEMDGSVWFNIGENQDDLIDQTFKLALMQYTGLKDVFESDIIRDHVGIGLVEYVDDKAAFRVNYKNGTAKWFIDYNLKGEMESIEVIGNIWESPELLEENE